MTTATLLRVEGGRRWGLVRVRGASMEPTLRAGDLVLVSRRRRPVPGDVIVGSFTDGTLVVKRVDHATAYRDRPAWYVVGDNPAAPNAMDSRARGPIPQDRVHGVVVIRLWPGPGPLRRSV